MQSLSKEFSRKRGQLRCDNDPDICATHQICVCLRYTNSYSIYAKGPKASNGIGYSSTSILDAMTNVHTILKRQHLRPDPQLEPLRTDVATEAHHRGFLQVHHPPSRRPAAVAMIH